MPTEVTTTPVLPVSPSLVAYEYLVRVTNPDGTAQDGTAQDVSAGSSRAAADSFAAAPLRQDPPGPPGEVWVRSVWITYGQWHPVAGER